MKLWQKFRMWLRAFLHGGGAGEFLCDSCKYDYGSACSRPERPNARVCPDYRRNG